MKKKGKLQRTVVITYAIALVAFFVFSVYMCFAEHNAIYQTRRIEPYEVLTDYTENRVEDASAPIGVRTEYRWKLQHITITKDYLAFYTVHQYADVYIDNELVYSLRPDETNRVAASTSSNWTFIPLDLSDNGRDIRVVITPIFRGVENRGVEFLLGARSDIMLKLLRNDLPQIVMSAVCIVIGIVLMVHQPIMLSLKKINSWQLFYLGNILLLIGAWRLTDTRSSALIFYKRVVALGYISLAALFLACAPLLLLLNGQFSGRKKTVLLLNSLLVSATSLAALLFQVFGVAELRELLLLFHILILVTVTVIFILFLMQVRKETKPSGLIWTVIPIFFGVLADFSSFCIRGNSSALIYTSLALLIYTVIRFVNEIYKITRKVRVDALTGLLNRSRWNELMDDPAPLSEATGIMMLDINRLKYTNDSMGHEMGDKMIRCFANILRRVLPADCLIFRWGGDEFTVLAHGADREKMEHYISDITAEANAYNTSGEKPEIYFAVGYAVSADYPDCSYEELFKKADEEMYRNKFEWRSKNTPHPEV